MANVRNRARKDRLQFVAPSLSRLRLLATCARGSSVPFLLRLNPVRRSRKPLSVYGGSRVRIPPPPLNQAGLESRPAAAEWFAVSRTFPVSPWKSIDVCGSPLVSRVTGADLAHRSKVDSCLLRQQRQTRADRLEEAASFVSRNVTTDTLAAQSAHGREGATSSHRSDG